MAQGVVLVGDSEAAPSPETASQPLTQPAPAKSIRRQCVVLGIFVLSLYLLTMGGHTSSSDDETMYAVTRSLATHGGLDVTLGTGAAVQLVLGVDGRYYAHYGLLPSIMALPLYVVGDAAAAWFPAAYHGYVTRLFVGLLDPFLTALTCVLVYLLGGRFGYSSRVSMLLALAFAMATLAWPYSKYFLNEPVAALWLVVATYAAFMSVRRSDVGWPLLAGLALGFSAASKIGQVTAAPGFLLYLLIAPPEAPALWPFRAHLSKRILSKRIVVFSSALLLVLLAIALSNLLRFGEIWKTGHWEGAPLPVAFRGALDANAIGVGDHRTGFWWGVTGLLVSPGKGLLIYCPILLLSFAAFRSFWSRLAPEAALIAYVFVSQWLLTGSIFYWHGDDSWGPRYMVPMLGLLILPAGAALCWTDGWRRRAAWSLFGLTALLGVLVQLGGVLMNYAVYNSRSGGTWGPAAEARRWDPARSPVLVNWQIIGQRAGAWLRPADVQIGPGFYEAENIIQGLFPRWTNGAGTLLITPPDEGRLRVAIDYINFRPPELGRMHVDVLVNGEPAPRGSVREDGGRNRGSVRVALDVPGGGTPLAITFQSNTWNPARDIGHIDDREVGIMITELEASLDGRALSVGQRSLPQPLPVSESHPWSFDAFYWFFVPETHLIDVWPWYVYTSGMPRWPMLLALLPAAGLPVSGFILARSLVQDR